MINIQYTISKTSSMGSIHMVISLLRCIIRSHRISWTFKAHAFFTSWTLNFKATWYSLYWSFALFICTYPSTHCWHVFCKQSIWPISSLMTTHSRMEYISATETIPFFTLWARIVWFIFNVTNKCTTCCKTKHKFPWMCKNEMIYWNF